MSMRNLDRHELTHLARSASQLSMDSLTRTAPPTNSTVSVSIDTMEVMALLSAVKATWSHGSTQHAAARVQKRQAVCVSAVPASQAHTPHPDLPQVSHI